MINEDIAVKLYHIGYRDAFNRSQPMNNDELLRLIKLMEKPNEKSIPAN